MPKHVLGIHNKRIRTSGTLLLRFKAYKAESTLLSMPRTLQSMPRSAKDVAKHA